MQFNSTTEFKKVTNLIRVRTVTYSDPDEGELTDFQFQVYKRSWFLGPKKWRTSIISNDYFTGFAFSVHLLGERTNKNRGIRIIAAQN